MGRRKSTHSHTLIRTYLLTRLSRFFLILTVVALFGLLFSSIAASQRNRDSSSPVSTVPSPTRLASVATHTPLPPPIALVAGHSGGTDTGAVCPGPDGAKEVEITVDVARRAKTILDARGYRVDILAEFDKRLNATTRDYSPRAFLAVHADSCVYTVSGFKVARAGNSAIASEDDRLVRCVKNAYQDATLLPFHADSITPDMTHYHGLQEINPQSPGAILELGFLGSDAETLKKRELLAQGVAEGLDAFLKGNECK